MTQNQQLLIPIGQYRTDPSSPVWELPPWGHPLSQGVLPLFLSVAGRLIPIGSAFTVGSGVAFLVSAYHNLKEVFSYEPRLHHLITALTHPEAIETKEVGIYVLHQRWEDSTKTKIHFALWPIESFAGALPSDVTLGFPQFTDRLGTLSMPLSFDVPSPGALVWSTGYADFKFPIEGIDLDEVKGGRFNWLTQYSHRFLVCEGRVQAIFLKRFANGYVEGPCFSFDVEVPHGLSGGPVLDMNGTVRGVNSASATNFLDGPATLASFLQPLLFQNICSGVQLGPMRIDSAIPIVEWIMRGTIQTDGSETRVPIGEGENQYTAGFAVPASFEGSVYDDFNGLRSGTPPAPQHSDHFLHLVPAGKERE